MIQAITPAEELFYNIGNAIPAAQLSQLFGKKCYKTDGKPFIAYSDDTMVFKLTGDKHSEAMSLQGAQLFDPSGKKRLMKEWIQVPYSENKHWKKLAAAALEYVDSIVK